MSLETKTIEQLRRSRSAISGIITKNAIKINAIADKAPVNVTNEDLATLRALLEEMQAKLTFALQLNTVILDKSEESDDAFDIEFQAGNKFEVKLQTQIKEIEGLIDRSTAQPIDSHFPQPITSRIMGVKMPKFDIPKFSGRYKDWIPFYDQFIAAVDQNDTIPDIQKLNYLKASLKDEAATLLAHLPLTASNYQVGIKLLENQYSNKRLILKAHMEAIHQAPSLRTESAEGLRRLQLTLDENLMAMEAMKIDTSLNCFYWVHIISEKLDAESRRQWELDSPGDNIRKINELRKFIAKRARALEASDKMKQNQQPQREKHFHTSPKNPHPFQSYKTTASICPACSGAHRIFNCQKFQKMSLTEKRNLAYTSKLCFNCLGEGHMTKDCPSTSTCKKCHKNHNTWLHADKVDNSKSKTIQETNLHLSSVKFNSVLLPTAVIPVVASDGSIIHSEHCLTVELN